MRDSTIRVQSFQLEIKYENLSAMPDLEDVAQPFNEFTASVDARIHQNSGHGDGDVSKSHIGALGCLSFQGAQLDLPLAPKSVPFAIAIPPLTRTRYAEKPPKPSENAEFRDLATKSVGTHSKCGGDVDVMDARVCWTIVR
ncbi:hypothetical protein CC1G_15531 [Coprinopsis cinerea okayama7|uniref:Uncharacterized protein n=1 Tax=Coprinopsis cinerea (strain Okayama-7 / 130 / ATCC MYA-4618 / FGSC 9003) TaxID=240176 RepID=D6RN19_COPC7|nr:hypothetical protein CC1G_15531 [Coprinopsis cinerea okayama7\|eukprot:XP_002910990.1 hypothetical protein CC1G_15531 [Coprinopsis cinerea okayama7\